VTSEQQIKELRDLEGRSKFVVLRVAVTVYKKTESKIGHLEVITELELPAGTIVFTGNSWHCGKMRANVALVKKNTLSVQWSIPKTRTVKESASHHDFRFRYRVGSVVVPDKFSRNKKTCAGGIHFFLDRKLAKAYRF
jgi:hypothetical protein